MIDTKRPTTGIMVTPVDTEMWLAEGLPRINASALALNDDAIPAVRLSIAADLGFVFKGDDLYVLNTEGVGKSDPLTDEDPFIVSLYRHWEATFEIIPSYQARLTRTDLLAMPINADGVEGVPLEKFIRTFGDRLEQNFHVWHRVLR